MSATSKNTVVRFKLNRPVSEGFPAKNAIALKLFNWRLAEYMDARKLPLITGEPSWAGLNNCEGISEPMPAEEARKVVEGLMVLFKEYDLTWEGWPEEQRARIEILTLDKK